MIRILVTFVAEKHGPAHQTDETLHHTKIVA
jgi:hypothetical protein